MHRYRYSGTSTEGKTVNGTLDAGERKAALRMLQQRGITPIRVWQDAKDSQSKSPRSVATTVKESPGKKPSRNHPVNRPRRADGKLRGTSQQGLVLARRLLELHSGGMSLGDSVLLLSQRLSEPKLKAVATALWGQLREGKSFARAAEAIPGLFPPAMFPLFEAGEASGDMVAILRNTIEYVEERKQLQARIMGSLAYPFILIFLVILILIGFVFFLMPRIQGMIDSMGGKMNFFTSTLIDLSELLLKGGPFALVAMVVGGVLLMQWRRTEHGRMATDRWVLRLPLIGPIIEATDLYQLSNLMATLMESGINASENLKLSERTIQNVWIKSRFATARAMIIEGASFSAAFKAQSLYPDSSIDILTVGENTGHLERGLREITQSVRSLLDQRLKILTITVSTLAMGTAFFMVLFAALGMVLSVLEVSQTISFQ